MKERFSLWAPTFVALAAPLGLLVGTLTGLVLKAANPSHVDITADLAYLGPALFAGYGTVIVLAGLGFLGALFGLSGSNQTQAKRTLITLLVLVLCVVGALISQKLTDRIEANYSKQSLERFYKNLNLPSPSKN